MAGSGTRALIEPLPAAYIAMRPAMCSGPNPAPRRFGDNVLNFRFILYLMFIR